MPDLSIRLIAVDEASRALERLAFSDRDQEFQMQFAWLAREICRVFEVTPQELGVVTIVDSWLVPETKDALLLPAPEERPL